MRIHTCLVLGAVACTALGLASQGLPSLPGAEKEHAFLKRFVGKWETTSECLAAPGQPLVKSSGTMSSRMLGDLWLICDSQMTMGEMKMSALLTIGHDSARKKYIGTWVDSVFNYLWRYEGTATENTLTLESEGPNFMTDGKSTRFQDIYEFKSADEIAITSKMLDAEGKWIEMMKGSARRVRG